MSRKFVHLIDDNGQFADGLQVLLEDGSNVDADDTETMSSSASSFADHSRISTTGTEYAIVGILGPQSSGKSTLLNHLFGTEFPTLSASGVRQQTTKGIYAAFEPDDRILILDLEGNDGVERAVSEKENLEKKLGLFSLCLSEILMINIWFHDIGRYSAANLGLLKIIFELHMQLKQGSKSLLLFVIRDQVEEQTPLSILATQLRRDVQQIWDESVKTFHPDAAVKTQLEEVFDCEFFGMPHYQFQKELFLEKVADLRTMINHNRKPEYRKNVPILDLHEYASKLWGMIEENKDLDVPTQRELFSRYRCEEISSSIEMISFTEPMQDLSRRIVKEENVVEGLKEIVDSVWKCAEEDYNSATKHYIPGVVEEVLTEMRTRFEEKVKPLVTKQCDLVHVHCLDVHKKGIKEVTSMRHLRNNIRGLYDTSIASWEASFNASIPSGCESFVDKDSLVNGFRSEMRYVNQERSNEILNAFRKRSIGQFELEDVASLLTSVFDQLSDMVDKDGNWKRLSSIQHSRKHSKGIQKAESSMKTGEGDEIESHPFWREIRILVDSFMAKWDRWLSKLTFDAEVGIEIDQKKQYDLCLKAAHASIRKKMEERLQYANYIMKQIFEDSWRHEPETSIRRLWSPKEDIIPSYKKALEKTFKIMDEILVFRLGSEMELDVHIVVPLSPSQRATLEYSRVDLHKKDGDEISDDMRVGDDEDEHDEHDEHDDHDEVEEQDELDNSDALMHLSEGTLLKEAEKYILIPLEKIQMEIDVFRKFSEMALTDAQRAKAMMPSGSIPPWIWLLFVVFGWNEAMWFLSHPAALFGVAVLLYVFFKNQDLIKYLVGMVWKRKTD